MIRVTIFNNVYDKYTNKNLSFSNFSKFEEFLFGLSKIKYKNKKDAKLLSPAIYQKQDTRANSNVIAWSQFAAVDIDTHDFKGDLEKELNALYGNWYYLCYSTASSRKEHPKFRLIFPLKAEIPSENISAFWHALNTEVGELVDKQTKDLSRMFYVPGTYSGAYNFFFINKGAYIEPDALIDKHPFKSTKGKTFFERLPEDLQELIIQRKKDLAENTGVSWSGYADCPFVNKKMVDSYKSMAYTDGTGRYHMIYKMMVSIACTAINRKYPITQTEVADLIRDIDLATSNIYQDRPLVIEAERAIEYAYRNQNM
jgi:hypothetical protein